MKRGLLLSSVLAVSASIAFAQDDYGFPEGFDTWAAETVTIEKTFDAENDAPTLIVSGTTSENFCWLGFSIPAGYDGVIGGPVDFSLMTKSDWVSKEDFIEMTQGTLAYVDELRWGLDIPAGQPFVGYYCFYNEEQGVDIESSFQVMANIEKVLPSVDVNFSEIRVDPYQCSGDVDWDGDVLNINVKTSNDIAELYFNLPLYYTNLIGNLVAVSQETRSEDGWENLQGQWNGDDFVPGLADKLQENPGYFHGDRWMNIPADGETYEGVVYLVAGDMANVVSPFKVRAKAEKFIPEFNGDFSELNARIEYGAEDGTVAWEGDNLVVKAQAYTGEIRILFDLPEGFNGLIGNIESSMFGTRSEDDWYPMWGQNHWNDETGEWESTPGAYDELSQQPGFFNNSDYLWVPANGQTFEGRVYMYAGNNVYVARPFNVIVTAYQPAEAPEFPTSFDVDVNPSAISHYQTSPSELSGEYYEAFKENAGWLLSSCENAIVLDGKTTAEKVDLSIALPEGWSGILAYKYDPSKVPSVDEGMRKVNSFEPGYPEEIWMPSWMVPVDEDTEFSFAVGEPQIYLCYLTTDAVRDYYVEGHLYDSANSFLIYVNVDVDIEALNQEAYNEVVAKIEVLQKEYTSALNEAKETYPSYDFSEWNQIIEEALDQAMSGAKQALEAANEDGETFQFAFDGEEIIAMIAEMQKAPVLAANEEAYKEVIAKLDELQAQYDQAVAEIKATNPNFDFTEWNEIGTMIESYKGYAAQALETANEDGESFNFAFDGEDILNYIQMMVKAANAAEFPASFDVTLNGKSSLDLIEVTQGEEEGVYTIKVSGMSLESKVTVALEVPAGWDGFVSMSEEDIDPEISPLTRAYDAEWVPVDMLLDYGYKESNQITFTVDGEDHQGSFYLVKDGEVDEANQIKVEFNVSDPTSTSGVSGVESIDANARYFDFNGHQIAKPAAGMYIKVLNGKATKVVLK